MLNGLNTLDVPDLYSINGYIQSIKTVLEIPTLLDHLAINDEFSLILEILNRQDIDKDYIQLLSGVEPNTFLAPTNEAIQSWIKNNPDWQSIDDIPVHTLHNILENLLIPNNNLVFDNKVRDLVVTTMNGETYSIQIDYPRWLIRNENKNLARINISNIQAENGIIHQVDRVLLP